jgi:23S rRNA pseudouridine2605 synthase
MNDRIQKILAHTGLGSRRFCEAYILAGRVTVNGHVAVIGEKADPSKDKICLDGKPIKVEAPPIHLALYKPRGVLSAVSTEDPRPTVRDMIDLPGFFYPVGRLDSDSEGLILMTNDGELAHRLTHPRYEHEKEYRVLVARRPDNDQLEKWRRGVVLEDGHHTESADVLFIRPEGKGAWLKVILREGHKRQIRETGKVIGLPIVRIIRTRIGTLLLGNMKPREWRYLTPKEVDLLKEIPSSSASKSTTYKPNKNKAL